MPQHIHFVDLTLRDGQQSLAATRMTTPQALRVLKMMEDTGFETLELWGGATLDSCVRFLNEDPWERLDTFRKTLGQTTQIRALLRGQNLFAYQPFPDDLVIAFTQEAVRSGVGVMRIFDALNDLRNLQMTLLATKAYGGKVEAAISYTTSPIHTTDYFVELALTLQNSGADRLAVKDMAGLLAPTTAMDLFRKLRERITIPITFHSHTTAGVATLNAVIAMQTGIDAIDTAITPFAGGTSHPPVELLIAFAEAMGLQHGLDKQLLLQIQARLFEVLAELREFAPSYGTHRPVHFKDIDEKVINDIVALVSRGDEAALDTALRLTRSMMAELGYPAFDPQIFTTQIPGGMLTNLRNQLQQMGKLDLLEQIMVEIPTVRADVGYVPMVTPTSQIVASQATFNVILGRYQMISNEFKMLLRGEFGRLPALPNPDVLRQALMNGEEPLRYRPASYLSPVMEDTYDLPFIKTHRDLLLHLMLKQPADEFLKRKYQAAS